MQSSGSDRSGRRRVLVVDDEPVIAELICSCLATCPEPLDVVRAENGRAALEAVERDRPDLVMLDINMPVMDGLETLKRLRVRHPKLPVLMITGSDGASVAAALKAGAFGYLPKPMDLRYIRHLVSLALGTQPAHTAATDGPR
jgi:two-component system, chemotaxis family, protein-glutamate methylesterase/glutaminase